MTLGTTGCHLLPSNRINMQLINTTKLPPKPEFSGIMEIHHHHINATFLASSSLSSYKPPVIFRPAQSRKTNRNRTSLLTGNLKSYRKVRPRLPIYQQFLQERPLPWALASNLSQDSEFDSGHQISESEINPESESGLISEELETRLKSEELESEFQDGKEKQKGKELAEEMECLEEEAIMGKNEGRNPTDYNRRAWIFDKSSRIFKDIKKC